MKINRYEIIKFASDDEFRVIDKLKDDFVCIPLTGDSAEELREIMGKSMNELVESDLVHPNYLKNDSN